MSVCLLIRDRKGVVDLNGSGGGEELGGVERGEPAFRIQCMKNYVQ